jgi:hypothetical protein
MSVGFFAQRIEWYKAVATALKIHKRSIPQKRETVEEKFFMSQVLGSFLLRFKKPFLV